MADIPRGRMRRMTETIRSLEANIRISRVLLRIFKSDANAMAKHFEQRELDYEPIDQSLEAALKLIEAVHEHANEFLSAQGINNDDDAATITPQSGGTKGGGG